MNTTVNMIVQAEPSEADYAQLTSEEKEHVERSKIWNKTGTGYGLEHGTRPSTIGLVLSSSPLALVAW
jgi:microsomal epoxide hydrolase